MANVSRYEFIYTITGNTTAGFTVVARTTHLNAVFDTSDGQLDSATAPNQPMTWSIDNGPVTLLGLASTGDPVILSPLFGPLLLSSVDFPLDEDIGFSDQRAFTYCFAAGTGIATPTGEVAVENLAIGDLVLSADGRNVPVRWIGRQTVSTLFGGQAARPVRIAVGALGAGLPHRDLTVTADHGMMIDGLVINAGALVNGTTITLVPLAELATRVTYYHIETSDHEVILANGAAAETFVDYAGRAAFDNYAEYLALYGAPQMIAELHAPRITSARLLPESIRARLATANAA